MSTNILITGGSGYLGGSLLAALRANLSLLPPHGTIYALVRGDEQARKVQVAYNATPLTIDLEDQDATTEALVQKEITIVYSLIDSLKSDLQVRLIKALAQVKNKMSRPVHFLHTSGAKLFSNHAGHPVDHDFSDSDAELYQIQKTSQSTFPIMQSGKDANTTVIDTAEAHGVRAYVFAPCIVYGEGKGFGNPISIQTVEVVRGARAAGQMMRVDPESWSWPVCHIDDNTSLYVHLLSRMISGEDVGYNKNGYYLASSGNVVWDDLYAAIAKALAKRGAIKDATVKEFSDENLEKLAPVWGCDKGFVTVLIGGSCRLTADHGKLIGWKPIYPPEHILEAADEEVALCLKHMK